ncbi:hypothetical protein STCU_03800 [Strigomonas culicis]|nr:hypothetical protein STCU_03800 [Strigomonas culicis]|eukprot:EPY30903.1 hypothetical protein STCU_03800 [Strigomonas culicis]
MNQFTSCERGHFNPSLYLHIIFFFIFSLVFLISSKGSPLILSDSLFSFLALSVAGYLADMLRRTGLNRFITKIMKVSKPPTSGYEISELPNEGVLREFMQFYKTKGVLVMVHSGESETQAPKAASQKQSGSSSETTANTLVKDPIMRSFVSSINALNLGNPDEVKLALVPGPEAPRLVDAYNIITYPTTLMFLDGRCVYRVVGARTNELSIKSLFMLRNGGRNIFSHT